MAAVVPTSHGFVRGSDNRGVHWLPGTPPADAVLRPADIAAPASAIDEQPAISVVDGSVEVISEGRWVRFG